MAVERIYFQEETGDKSTTVVTKGLTKSGVTWQHKERATSALSRQTVTPDNQHVVPLLTRLSDTFTIPDVDQWQETIQPLLTETLERYHDLPADQQIIMRNDLNAALENSEEPDRAKVAHVYLALNQGMIEETAEGTLPTTKGLSRILPEETFDAVGAMIASGIKTKEGIAEVAREQLPDLTEAVVYGVVDAYAHVGAIKVDNGSIKRSRGKDLTHGTVAKAVTAAELLTPPQLLRPQADTFEAIIESHEQAFEDLQVNTVEVGVAKESVKVLTLSEALLGYASSDPRFVQRVINTVSQSPEVKPDVIVASGVLFGGHKYREKALRGVTSLPLDRQFAAAQVLLKELSEKTGAVVVYSLSDNDHEVARDMALDATKALRSSARALLKHQNEDDFLTFEQQDRIIRTPEFQHHLKIATNVMFEYCLRSGRTLRSAEELARKTRGAKGVEGRDEYSLVLEAFTLLANGQEVPSSLSSLINVDAIPLPGRRHTDFFVEDNFNLITTMDTPEGKSLLQKYRHNLKLGNIALYQDHINATQEAVRQMLAEGKQLDALVTMHHHAAEGSMTPEGVWAVSTSGMIRRGSDAIDFKGEVFGTRGVHTRQISSRRLMSVPGAEIHEDTADGRHKVWFMNNELLDIAEKHPHERVTIAQFIDWQTGSVTMRPDLQIKFMDMVKQKILNDEKVYIFWGGDIIQGRNYPAMPNENDRIGLVRIERQKAFVLNMIQNVFDDVPVEKRKNIVGVSIVPGNHEWNSRYNDTGDAHIGYLSQYMHEWLGPAFTPDQLKDMIRVHDAMRTHDGSFIDVWAGVVSIAGYNVLMQHLMTEKGSNKGGGGNPVAQGVAMIKGQGGLMRKVNVITTGHMHSPQYAEYDGKIVTISGAMAGESGYEWFRAHRASIGGSFIHLGGGLPPAIEFVGAEALLKHEIQEGYYSDEQLAQRGFVTPPTHNPRRDGFLPRPHRRATQNTSNALVQELWAEIDDLAHDTQSEL